MDRFKMTCPKWLKGFFYACPYWVFFYQNFLIKQIRNFSSEITTASLCLTKVSFIIPALANLRYGCKPALNMLIKKTLVVFTYKQLSF